MTHIDIHSEGLRLARAWLDAFEPRDRENTYQTYDEECSTHDALVDFVEANELNGSPIDPRNDSSPARIRELLDA